MIVAPPSSLESNGQPVNQPAATQKSKHLLNPERFKAVLAEDESFQSFLAKTFSPASEHPNQATEHGNSGSTLPAPQLDAQVMGQLQVALQAGNIPSNIALSVHVGGMAPLQPIFDDTARI